MKNRSIDELKEIAKGIFHNEIFTDRHVREASKILLIIFMPLAFANDEMIEEMKSGSIGLIFEYYCRSMKSGINGYPVFPSCNFLSKNDTKIVFDILSELECAEMKAMNKSY